jgi:hypothetical protein
MHLFLFASGYIQDVPGGKVNILGGYSIGHYKQEKVYTYILVQVSYSERVPIYIYISLYSYKLLIKNIPPTVSNTGIYSSSDKGRTVYIR